MKIYLKKITLLAFVILSFGCKKEVVTPEPEHKPAVVPTHLLGSKTVWKQGNLDINTESYSYNYRSDINYIEKSNGFLMAYIKYVLSFNFQDQSKYFGYAWIDNPFPSQITKEYHVLPKLSDPNKLDPFIKRITASAGSFKNQQDSVIVYLKAVYQFSSAEGKTWYEPQMKFKGQLILHFEDFYFNSSIPTKLTTSSAAVNLRGFLIGSGGTITGAGVNNEIFDPKVVGAGTYTITATKPGFYNGSETLQDAVSKISIVVN